MTSLSLKPSLVVVHQFGGVSIAIKESSALLYVPFGSAGSSGRLVVRKRSSFHQSRCNAIR